MDRTSSWFERTLLPGLAFKAAVIGGGYATGRELASFFLPSGMVGGLYGMLLVIPIWSLVCALTFLLAHRSQSFDYRTFFKQLLGRFWWLYEIGWILAILVILAVFVAAAGEIGAALFGWPRIVGGLALALLMATCAGGGGKSVEWLFKWASVVLYVTFAMLLVLLSTKFSDRILASFDGPPADSSWILGGLTYCGYNIIGAVVVLPVARHFTSGRDAVVAGVLAGPLAMVPAILFFIGMGAFYPQIQNAPLPSDLLLQHIGLPWFRLLFQGMIFCALLESGTSGLHAINERVDHVYRARRGVSLSAGGRFLLAAAILFGAVCVAGQFGLVALVAQGYRWLSYLFLAVYVAPLLLYGLRLGTGRYRRGRAVPAI